MIYNNIKYTLLDFKKYLNDDKIMSKLQSYFEGLKIHNWKWVFNGGTKC